MTRTTEGRRDGGTERRRDGEKHRSLSEAEGLKSLKGVKRHRPLSEAEGEM